MIHAKEEITLYGKKYMADIIRYEESDIIFWKFIHFGYSLMNSYLFLLKRRKANLHEALSEIGFCLAMKKYFNIDIIFVEKIYGNVNQSFDLFDKTNNKTIQIKASGASKDFSSFGPKSKFEELYFVDFFNVDGNLEFKIYKLNHKWFSKLKTSKKETFKEKQKNGKRPHTKIRDIINKKKLEPICIYTYELNALEILNTLLKNLQLNENPKNWVKSGIKK